MKEDNLSKKERKEVKKEIKKLLSKHIVEKSTAFGSKFKEQTSTAIITAFGLVTALAWKDVITELVKTLNPIQNLLISAIIVTILSIIGISLMSRWAKKKDPTIKLEDITS